MPADGSDRIPDVTAPDRTFAPLLPDDELALPITDAYIRFRGSNG